MLRPQKRHKPADFRRRHEKKTLKGTFKFSKFFDQSELRLVAEELEANERAIKAMSKVICKAL